MDLADEIWNNALESEPASDRPGDVGLHYALLVNGLVQNGGVLHAMESLTASELNAGCDGLAGLALVDAAQMLREVDGRRRALADSDEAGLEALEIEANDRYAVDDAALEAALRACLERDPDAFADPTHEEAGRHGRRRGLLRR